MAAILKEGPIRKMLKERGVLKQSPEMEKRFYYCDNPRHPYSEIVQVLTYEIDPRCPICLTRLLESRVMTYGRYWK